MLIEDSSGKSALKIWGLHPNSFPNEGEYITLTTSGGQKSSIRNQEWPAGSGKFTINAAECQMTKGQESSPGEAASHPTTAQSYPGTTGDKMPATAKRSAEFIHLQIEALQAQGYSREEAIQLSVNAGSIYPLFWFGEKGQS